MVLSCLPGASLSKGIQSARSSRPWRPPQDLPRTRPLAIEIVLKVRQNPAPFQNKDSIGNPVLQVSLVSPWCLPGKPNGSFLPPWTAQLILSCLPGASQAVQMVFPASLVPRKLPNGSFLPPWCLAGCQAVQMVLSCLPGASLSKGIQSVLGSRPWRPPQDLPRTGPFAIEIILKVKQNPAPFQNRNSIGNPVLQVSLVPPWCLASCPIDPFLPPWCLAVQLILSCFPGASQAVQMVLSCLPGASLVPRRLSN